MDNQEDRIDLIKAVWDRKGMIGEIPPDLLDEIVTKARETHKKSGARLWAITEWWATILIEKYKTSGEYSR